jgi:hypothetical protein
MYTTNHGKPTIYTVKPALKGAFIQQRFIKTIFPSSLEWTLYTGFTVFDIRIVEELCLFMIMTRGGSRISI